MTSMNDAFLSGIRSDVAVDLHLSVTPGVVSQLLTNDTELSPRYRLQTLRRDGVLAFKTHTVRTVVYALHRRANSANQRGFAVQILHRHLALRSFPGHINGIRDLLDSNRVAPSRSCPRLP